jgi:hypothetical protein
VGAEQLAKGWAGNELSDLAVRLDKATDGSAAGWFCQYYRTRVPIASKRRSAVTNSPAHVVARVRWILLGQLRLTGCTTGSNGFRPE